MASRKERVLISVNQQQMAEHSTRLGLEHLRNAATMYEQAGRSVTARVMRETIVTLRKQAFHQPVGYEEIEW